jgi:MFS family permease
VFWVAVIPAALSFALMAFAVREPKREPGAAPAVPFSWRAAHGLGRAFWWVAAAGATLTLARFSEAFLVLRAENVGVALAWTPLVMVAMNVVFALIAYPAGRLADRIGPHHLLAIGTAALVAADIILGLASDVVALAAGIVLWGVHMGLTQGLLAALVAAVSPAQRRGTAFGVFNLVCGAAMLIASVVAGALWHYVGPAATFLGGAVLAAAAIGVTRCAVR